MEKKYFIKCKICGNKNYFESKVERELWKDDGFECRSCKTKWCSHTETESELLTIQDKFLKSNKSQKYMTQLYNALFPYVSNMIKKSPYLVESNEDLIYYTQNTVSLVLEGYYSKKNFKVERSFGGLIAFKIKEAFFSIKETGKSPKDEEGNKIPLESLNFVFEDGSQIEYEYEDKGIIEIELNEHIQFLHDHLTNIVFGVYDLQYCSYSDFYIILNGIEIFLLKGENFSSKFFSLYGRKGKEIFQKILDILKEEIKKSI